MNHAKRAGLFFRLLAAASLAAAFGLGPVAGAADTVASNGSSANRWVATWSAAPLKPRAEQ